MVFKIIFIVITIFFIFQNNTRTKKICSFNLEAVFKSIPNSIIKHHHKSMGKYFNNLENNFTILPDQKTLIGFSKSNDTLQTENITRNHRPVIIDGKKGIAYCMIFNINTESLLVGYSSGHLIQYKQAAFGTWKIEREYGDIGVGSIFSLSLIHI